MQCVHVSHNSPAHTQAHTCMSTVDNMAPREEAAKEQGKHGRKVGGFFK